MNNQLMFSKKSDDWSTPEDLFRELDKEFNFSFDPCPLKSDDLTALLFKDWTGSVFVNPPYSNIGNFMNKALLELKKGNAHTVVFLVPARTDTRWFHKYVLGWGGGNQIHQRKAQIWRSEKYSSVSFNYCGVEKACQGVA